MKNYNRELGFVLMVLNIREVTAQRAENNQNYNKDNFYIISIEIVFVYLSWDFMSHTLYSFTSNISIVDRIYFIFATSNFL